MSEVKRYMAIGGMLPGEGFGDGVYVRDEDFRAAQSELAALREELAEQEKTWTARFELLCEGAIRPIVLERNDAQQRLADAERRNAVMREALETLNNYGFDPSSGSGSWGEIRITLEDWNLIQAAMTQPTESGASE